MRWMDDSQRDKMSVYENRYLIPKDKSIWSCYKYTPAALFNLSVNQFAANVLNVENNKRMKEKEKKLEGRERILSQNQLFPSTRKQMNTIKQTISNPRTS